MGAECLFCRIVAGSIPAKRARCKEDELCLAFADINPQAPVHLLVIPKEHIASTAHAEATHAALLGHLVAKAAEIARGRRAGQAATGMVSQYGRGRRADGRPFTCGPFAGRAAYELAARLMRLAVWAGDFVS